MEDPTFFDQILTNFWNPVTFGKMVFVLLTMPFWLPLARVMYREFLPALNAPDEENIPRRPAGEDPFLNIPLASHRAHLAREAGHAGRRGR